MNKYFLVFSVVLALGATNAYSSACQTFVDSKTYDDASSCLDEMTNAAKLKYGDTRNVPQGAMLAALRALGVAVRNKNNFKLNSGNAIMRTRDYLASDEATAAAPATGDSTAAPATGGAENPEYAKAIKLLGMLSNKAANYTGGDKDQIKNELDALTNKVNTDCADQSSDACTAVLGDKTPFRSLVNKLQGVSRDAPEPAGAAAATTACDIKPEKGSARACFDELNAVWEKEKANTESPIYKPLSTALKSMNAAATSCDGPRTVNCARMTDNAKRSYEAYQAAASGAAPAAAAAPAPAASSKKAIVKRVGPTIGTGRGKQER